MRKVLLNLNVRCLSIEEHHRCLGLDGYFMAAVLVAAIYSRVGFSLCLAVCARGVRVPGGSVFHLEPGTIFCMSSTKFFSKYGLQDNYWLWSSVIKLVDDVVF